ncbi:MAG: PF20097 family protein [Candidatus Hermodarchaeota archaeon]
MPNKIEGMKCHICGESMEKGFLISVRDIYWNKNVPNFFCKGQKRLSSSMWHGCSTIPAFRCHKCKITVGIDFEQSIPPIHRSY